MDEQRRKRINDILDLFFLNKKQDESSRNLMNSVREWFAESSMIEEKYAALEEAFGKHITYNPKPSAEAIVSLLNTMQKLGLPVSESVLRSAKKPSGKRILLKRIMSRIAAVTIPLIVTAGIYMIYTRNSPQQGQTEQVAEAVPSGIAYRLITLPDDSSVWLRNGSTVTYSPEFGRRRKVSLEGEAFFKVTGNNHRAFIVETRGITIKVTGTAFNVSAWSENDKVRITLHEGNVKVKADKSWIDVKQGEQFDYNSATGESETNKIDVGSADWRNRKLDFVDITLQEIFAKVEGIYGIAVESNIEYSGESYMVSFAPGEGLDVIMSILKSASGEFDYEIAPGKVIISKPAE